MDVLANFIFTKCVEGPGIRVHSAPLYNAYKDWCDETGEFKLTQTRFSTRLKERGYEKKKVEQGIMWIGIGLKWDDDGPDGPGDGGLDPAAFRITHR